MDAVIFFDIRNFSAHRQLLGLTKSAKPLSVLVIDLLEKAVMLGNSLVPRFGIGKLPLLNHTGDGFVIVLQGGRACLAALIFASEFREFAEVKLATYQSRFDKCHEDAEPETKLPSKLDYGMGVHCGSVTPLKYKSFRGTRMIFWALRSI